MGDVAKDPALTPQRIDPHQVSLSTQQAAPEKSKPVSKIAAYLQHLQDAGAIVPQDSLPTRDVNELSAVEELKLVGLAAAPAPAPQPSLEDSLDLLKRFDHCLGLFEKGIAAHAKTVPDQQRCLAPAQSHASKTARKHPASNNGASAHVDQPQTAVLHKNSGAAGALKQASENTSGESSGSIKSGNDGGGDSGVGQNEQGATRLLTDHKTAAPHRKKRLVASRGKPWLEVPSLWLDAAEAERSSLILQLPPPSSRTCASCGGLASVSCEKGPDNVMVLSAPTGGPTVICNYCGAHVHSECLSPNIPRPVHGEDGYIFTCKLCAGPSGEASVVRASGIGNGVKWETLVRIAAVNITAQALEGRSMMLMKEDLESRSMSQPLTLTLQNKDGSLDDSLLKPVEARIVWFTASDICLYLQEHWKGLCADKKPSSPWASSVSAILEVRRISSGLSFRPQFLQRDLLTLSLLRALLN